MVHVLILFNILTLVIGSWAAFYTWQIRKFYNHLFLTPIIYFIAFYNLMIFNSIIMSYVMTNMFENMSAYNSSQFARSILPVSHLIYMLLTCFLLQIIFGLFGKTIPGKNRKWLISFIFIICFVLLMFSLFPVENFLYNWYHTITVVLSIFLDIFIVINFIIANYQGLQASGYIH